MNRQAQEFKPAQAGSGCVGEAGKRGLPRWVTFLAGGFIHQQMGGQPSLAQEITPTSLKLTHMGSGGRGREAPAHNNLAVAPICVSLVHGRSTPISAFCIGQSNVSPCQDTQARDRPLSPFPIDAPRGLTSHRSHSLLPYSS